MMDGRTNFPRTRNFVFRPQSNPQHPINKVNIISRGKSSPRGLLRPARAHLRRNSSKQAPQMPFSDSARSSRPTAELSPGDRGDLARPDCEPFSPLPCVRAQAQRASAKSKTGSNAGRDWSLPPREATLYMHCMRRILYAEPRNRIEVPLLKTLKKVFGLRVLRFSGTVREVTGKEPQSRQREFENFTLVPGRGGRSGEGKFSHVS